LHALNLAAAESEGDQGAGDGCIRIRDKDVRLNESGLSDPSAPWTGTSLCDQEFVFINRLKKETTFAKRRSRLSDPENRTVSSQVFFAGTVGS
jgi:hypothetical protein